MSFDLVAALVSVVFLFVTGWAQHRGVISVRAKLHRLVTGGLLMLGCGIAALLSYPHLGQVLGISLALGFFCSTPSAYGFGSAAVLTPEMG